MSQQPLAKAAEATVEFTKKHGVKTAGVTSMATIIIAGQAYFAPLADYKETRKEVQALREKIGQLEWAHERAGRHGLAESEEISFTNAVLAADSTDKSVNPTRKEP